MENTHTQATNPSTPLVTKKVHVETWGCQMNVADSEHMLGLLAEQNYELTQDEDEADLFLLNTCHIRDKARHKVVSRLGRLAKKKKDKPGMKIALAGCVAQAEGKKLASELAHIDIVVSPSKIQDLPKLVKQNQTSGKAAISVGYEKQAASSSDADAKGSLELRKNLPTLSGKTEVSRFVNIMQGCNNFCTFCVVPYTRGKEISRPHDEVIKEVEMLAKNGAREVSLLGQNVNSYGLDLEENTQAGTKTPFTRLLERVCQVEGVDRVRFTTSNPHDFTQDLARLFAEKREIMGEYLHLPVQSGSDRILSEMRRKVTREEFLERVQWLRSTNPEFAISTDLIVGFPTETDEEFEETLSLAEEVRFSFGFYFKYSPRPRTPAARMGGQVVEGVMDKRLAKLNALQDQITLDWNQKQIGKEEPVLILYPSRKEQNVFYGRTPSFRLAKVAANRNILGAMVGVKIESANKIALAGTLI